MKLWMPVLLVAAGAAAAWLYGTRREPTYVPLSEPPTAFAPAPTVLTREPGAGEVLDEVAVEGMCCKGCTGKLYAKLMTVPGVEVGAVDFDSGRARAIAKSGLSSADLAAALTFDKYTATPTR